jgi:hypothetical protein
MALSLDDLITQFKESDQKKTSFSNGDWYPFWKGDFDQTATFRFLPDGDPNASHFLVEKWQHRLEVSIDGKTEQRSIPCLAQYGKNCPVCNTAKKFYDDGDEDNGSRFYKKRSWIGQGIVVDSPFDYEEPEKQPKLISIGWQIYSSIKTAIMQRDVECLPTDYEKGYNFRITKTRQGTRANYANSRFAPHPSAVDPALLEGIELHILKDKLPREPDLKNVEAMLTSALTGEPYTPPGRSNQESAAATPDAGFTTPDRSTPVVESTPDTTPPWEEPTAVVKPAEPVAEEAPAEADEILAAIARRKAERSE